MLIGTDFNIYNVVRLYLNDVSTHQEATEKFLENRQDNLHHFRSNPHLGDHIGWPRRTTEEVDVLRNLYEKYDNVTSFAFIPAIFYLLPENLDGIIFGGSQTFSGVLASVLKNLNIPAIQSFFDTARGNYSEIFSDFDNDGTPDRIIVEGNVPFGEENS